MADPKEPTPQQSPAPVPIAAAGDPYTAGFNLVGEVIKFLGDRIDAKYINEQIQISKDEAEEWAKYPEIDGQKINELRQRKIDIQIGITYALKKLDPHH